jgi:hypothetical protein
MNLEQMQARLKEVEGAMVNLVNQHNQFMGHKAELEFQISELSKPVADEPPEPVAPVALCQ